MPPVAGPMADILAIIAAIILGGDSRAQANEMRHISAPILSVGVVGAMRLARSLSARAAALSSRIEVSSTRGAGINFWA